MSDKCTNNTLPEKSFAHPHNCCYNFRHFDMAMKGYLRRNPLYKPVYSFVEWSFEYRVHPEGSNVQYLRKIDLDYVDNRDQISIWCKAVRSYIQERTDIVSVHMNLPQEIERVIIFQFGRWEPVCFAENIGDGLHVYDGDKLAKNPFTFEEELRRLRMSRHRRKYLF